MAEGIDFSKCPVGAAVVTKIESVHSDVKEIKTDVKAQNSRVRKLEQNKVDKSELNTVYKKLDKNTSNNIKILAATSTAIALISLFLLAIQAISTFKDNF